MIEKVYNVTVTNDKTVERIVDDEHVNINHMVLIKDTGLPVHVSNSNVYMVIVRGTMTIALDDEPANLHREGEILAIPFNTKMEVTNKHEAVLEFYVLKSPNPKDMPTVKKI
jgi:quercetin dioxygenase-like cupin family protein